MTLNKLNIIYTIYLLYIFKKLISVVVGRLTVIMTPKISAIDFITYFHMCIVNFIVLYFFRE